MIQIKKVINIFEPKDPLALKIVYWFNIIIVILLAVIGVLGSYTFSPFWALFGYAGAIIWYYFFTKALKNKKQYSYWLNLIARGLSIIVFVIGIFFGEFNLVGLFSQAITLAIIYLLLRREMREIFIKT